MALVATAIAFGGWLRFATIGAREMSADEGASWAAAAAPSLGEVVRIQAVLNPGKLAVYEVVLHGWIILFGDGLGAMRALSAMLDTFSIVVVFALVGELLGARSPPQNEGAGFEALPPQEARTVAALAAVLFAVNLVSIKYARELRMYPLALLIALLQVWVFIRAVRRGSGFDLAPLAVLTALAVATHFSAAFMVVTDALCLAALPLMPLRRARPPRTVWPFAVAAALGAGAALFLVVALPALRTGASAFAQGATGWIERPRWWAPLALFNKGVGSFAFPVMAALAGWGVWRGWGRARAATAFALAWMWTPPLLMLVASYAFSPMFVERYALWCFVPLFMLAALGAWESHSVSMRVVAIALAVALALGHLHAYRRRPHDTQWREAAHAAADALAPGMKIAVAPPYAVNAVRYYLRDTQSAAAAVAAGDSDAANSDARVLIIGDQWNARDKTAKLLAQYPYPLASFRGVRVCGRGARAQRDPLAGDDVMSDQDQPASQLKQQQRIDWDAAAAGWKQWWSTFEHAAQHVSDRLVELAAVRAGDRVADLATGIGEPAITAARRVGTAGRVVAIDQSPGMLTVARERAASLGLGNLEFRVGDIESLEADEHSFDAAICRWGLMFVPDLDSAARGIRRALKPGGRFTTAVWAAPDKVPMISLGGEAVRTLAGLPPRQSGALDPFRLADVSILTRALEGAGFTEVRSEPLEVVFEFASTDEFTRFRADVSSPLRAVLERCTPEMREQILRATAEAAAPYRRPDGSLRLPNVTVCVAARA